MDVEYKIPVESPQYSEWSKYVVGHVGGIIKAAIDKRDNLIYIRTNLRRGLPLENINKVAGPFVEAWAAEQFEIIAEQSDNVFDLVNIDVSSRLGMADVVLQFKRQAEEAVPDYISASVDVKATSQDIPKSGKSPNITSYARIRTEYVKDADYLFIVLALKHKVYGAKDPETALTNGVMEITNYAVYDLKWVSTSDLSYNGALGTGQIQIKDISYVSVQQRTTWEFLQLLDAKFIKSRGEAAWLVFAKKYQWIKSE